MKITGEEAEVVRSSSVVEVSSAEVAEEASAVVASEAVWEVAAEPVHGSERNGRASPVTNQFRLHH